MLNYLWQKITSTLFHYVLLNRMPQRPSNIWALVKLVMFLPFQLSEVSVLIKYLYVDGYFPLDLLCMWIYWPQILSIPKVTVVCRRSFRNQRRRGTFGRVDAGSPCISQPLPPWWPQSVVASIPSPHSLQVREVALLRRLLFAETLDAEFVS